MRFPNSFVTCACPFLPNVRIHHITVYGRLQEEVQNAEKPEAGRNGCWEHEEACLEVVPAKDGGALLRGTVPAQCEGLPNRPVLAFPQESLVDVVEC